MSTIEEFWDDLQSWDRYPRALFDRHIVQVRKAHAHELAEEIRAAFEESGNGHDHWAANIIDPEVK